MAFRKKLLAEVKSKIVLKALKEQNTANEIASEFQVHPVQIAKWKKQAIEGLPSVFETKGEKERRSNHQLVESKDLFEQVGRLQMQLEWLKKNLALSINQKRVLIEPGHLSLSIAEQCDILGLVRSSYYYEAASESLENLQYMRLLDELYLKYPAYGYRRMQIELKRAGHHVNEKRVLRLMQLMSIQSILPKQNLSVANKEHKKYPYLLNGLLIYKPLQVYAIDITYIPMSNGFMYLTAIIDVYSRFILAWEVSNSLDVMFCLEALKTALNKYGCPEIFNMDQGSQFTCEQFLDILIANGIQISMDGKGRAIDNIFIERFWWSLKYEIVYPSHWITVPEVIQGIRDYIEYYCNKRPHQSLGYATPNEILTGQLLRGFGEQYKGLTTRKR